MARRQGDDRERQTVRLGGELVTSEGARQITIAYSEHEQQVHIANRILAKRRELVDR